MNTLRRGFFTLLLAIVTAVGLIFVQVHHSPATPLPDKAEDSPPLTLASAGLTMTQLAEGVYGFIASTDFQPQNPNAAICNAAIVIGSEGVLVLDPFQNEALANLLFETVKELTDQPIRYVVNSHYHFDHSGGNAAAEALHYPILGRGPIREFMLTRNLELDPNATPPSVILKNSGELWLGDREIQLTEFDGHSGGTDLILYLPDVDVLFAGDLLFTQRIPYVADGNLRVWKSTLEELQGDYATAKILPGHGPVSDRDDLKMLSTYLQDLENLALLWKTKGLTKEQAIDQTPVPAAYANYLFQGLFTSNLETAYQQITLGEDDRASIQAYFEAQPPELKAI